MKTLTAAIALIFAVPAFAHVKVGTYQGTNPEGEPCSFVVRSVSFLNHVHHPLNGRVEILTEAGSFVLSHPPVVDVQNATVGFDHDHLQGVQGQKNGTAIAAVLTMDHSEGNDGPSQLDFIFHSRASSSGRRTTCGQLVAPN